MLNHLNTRQQEAVRHIHTPLMVLAGAGSGKTSVITHKIAFLIKQHYYIAQQITAVTFTNKAAKEMNTRVRNMLPSSMTRGLNISTFHSLGLRIIKLEHKHLNIKKDFSIYDSDDCLSLLKRIIEETNPNLDKTIRDEYAVEMKQMISQWKNDYLLPEDLLKQPEYQTIEPEKLDIYQQYQQHLTTFHALDFDDLIILPVKLFISNPDILVKWQNSIAYLLIDEYQDTNLAQYKLIKLLCSSENKSMNPTTLTVVGDDDQSIYGWRGARPENLSILHKDFENLHIIKLEQNYRSSGLILKAANAVIKHNPHDFIKKLWSEHNYGDPIEIICASEEYSEVEFIVTSMIDLHFRKHRLYSDFAILYRGNHQSRNFEKKLQEHQIPYKVTGGVSFFSYTEIKDIMAYLKLLINPDDEGAFLRIINTPKRQIGDVTVKKLAEYSLLINKPLFRCCNDNGLSAFMDKKSAQKLSDFYFWIEKLRKLAGNKTPITAIKQLIQDTAYFDWLLENSSTENRAKRKIENVDELINWLQRLQDKEQEESQQNPELNNLVNKLILMDILQRGEEEELTDCVSLMTLHSSKGLEFNHVFISGVEEELIPHLANIESDNIEEERRLFYVGITRAKEKLTLTYSASRKRYGEQIITQPSRFISELPQEDITWINKESQSEKEKKQYAQNSFATLEALLE